MEIAVNVTSCQRVFSWESAACLNNSQHHDKATAVRATGERDQLTGVSESCTTWPDSAQFCADDEITSFVKMIAH